MNAYELADHLEKANYVGAIKAANMLRQQEGELEYYKVRDGSHLKIIKEQSDRIAKYEQVLQSIANEKTELSHDKIKWQCEDHIRWAKEALE